MADGLQRLGIDAQARPDGMVITGGELQGGEVEVTMIIAFRCLLPCCIARQGSDYCEQLCACRHFISRFVTLAQRSGISQKNLLLNHYTKFL